MTDTMCDMLICIGGGTQSFLQVCNVLTSSVEKPIIYIKDAKNFHHSGDDIKYFDASEFMSLLFKSSNPVETKELYLKKRVLYNAKKGDAVNKQLLFDNAFVKIVDHLKSKL